MKIWLDCSNWLIYISNNKWISIRFKYEYKLSGSSHNIDNNNINKLCICNRIDIYDDNDEKETESVSKKSNLSTRKAKLKYIVKV